jgi:integrase
MRHFPAEGVVVPKKRTGTIECRDGIYYVRPTLADGTRGPRRALPKGTTPARAKEAAAALTERAHREGKTQADVHRKPEQVEAPKGRAVADWFAAWLDERERRGLTSVKDDRGRWGKWIAPKLGHLEIAKASTDDLEAFVEHLDERVAAGDLSWKTAKNVWGLVTKAFDDACRSKTRALRVRKDNPAKDVRGPDQGTKRSKQYLYPSEFVAVMNCDKVPVRWRRLIAVNIYLYCRAGELEALHVDDADLDHRVVHIHRSVDRQTGELKETKTNNPRRLPMEPNIVPLIAQLVAEARAEDRDRLVKMPALCDLSVRLRQYLRWAGVARSELYKTTPTSKQVTWHDLRATGATWMAIRGDEPQRIMARCGHENMATTMGYVREAESLNVPRHSVFPDLPAALNCPPELTEDAQTWGRTGGNRSVEARSSGVPSGIRTRSMGAEKRKNAADLHGSDVGEPCRSVPSKTPEGHEGADIGRLVVGEHPNPLGTLPRTADPPPRVPDPHEPVRLNFEAGVRLSLTEAPDHGAEEAVADLIRASLDALEGEES